MPDSRFEEFVFERMSETKIPGLSAAAVTEGEVVWCKGFGFRDLKSGLASTPRTLYPTASVTKPFTATAIMQLKEQGKLSLDDPVDMSLLGAVRGQREDVRLWHLLTHTSGIPALGYVECAIRGSTGAGNEWLPIASYSDLVAFMGNAAEWAISKPGDRWLYLNEGYVLLGHRIEECSGTSYEEYMHEHILNPLGMVRSYFLKEEVAEDSDLAIPYLITRDGDRLPSTYPFGTLSSDSGLVSNVLDLARFISMLLGRGEYGGMRVLSPRSVEEMQDPRVVTPVETEFGKYEYGHGFRILPQFLEHRLVDHTGAIDVATAYIGLIPERGVGIVILANGSGYPLSQLGMYGLAIMLGKDPDKLPFVQKQAILRELEGMYETYRGTMKLRVRRIGDFLTAEIKDKRNTRATPLVPTCGEHNSLAFYTLANGTRFPVEFRVHGREVILIYERYCLRKVGKSAGLW